MINSWNILPLIIYVFLLCQVGPKKKNLKVKNFDEFEFKPQEIVSNICQIYINLGDSDEFCLAVSKDGRSYSHVLFLQADIVLRKIHRPQDMIIEMNEIAAKIKVSWFHASATIYVLPSRLVAWLCLLGNESQRYLCIWCSLLVFHCTEFLWEWRENLHVHVYMCFPCIVRLCMGDYHLMASYVYMYISIGDVHCPGWRGGGTGRCSWGVSWPDHGYIDERSGIAANLR